MYYFIAEVNIMSLHLDILYKVAFYCTNSMVKIQYGCFSAKNKMFSIY